MAILIDYSHALQRNLYMNVDAVNEDPDFVAHILITQILSFNKLFGASKTNPVYLCLDNGSWRKQYYIDNLPKSSEYVGQTYKGDRIKNDTIKDWSSIFKVASDVAETLKLYSDMFTLSVPNCEGDDCLAVIAKELSKTQEVFLISGDKDMLQCQSDNVHIYDPIKKIYFPKINVTESKTLDIIEGGHDNIKAIKSRVGKKTALKMLPELDILLQTNPDMKEKFIFNQNLIDFDFIPEYIQENILAEYKKQEFSYNATKLMQMCKKYKLVKLLERLQEFKLSDNVIKTKLNQHFITTAINQKKAASSLEDFFAD